MPEPLTILVLVKTAIEGAVGKDDAFQRSGRTFPAMMSAHDAHEVEARFALRRHARADRLKTLERENRELRQANEILSKASAYFAQAELDRPFKR